ncbi:MAG: hypothetical protein HQL61_16975 [Magnetococcales bacterium]|nr:hypothetical protein [Nitrospirota bacterium]
MNRRLAIAIAVICIMLGVYVLNPSYTGRVVELETGKPIEGAVVAIEWTIEYQIGVNSCYKETITDKNGKFRLYAVSCSVLSYVPYLSKLVCHDVVIFKPGYLGYPPIKEKKSLYTGVKFDKDHRYNVIMLDKAVTPDERSEILNEATSFAFLGNRIMGKERKMEPHDVIFERELPHLFKLTKQEEEFLKKEWEQRIKETYKGDPAKEPPANAPPIIKQSVNKNKGGNK